ncbi:MAG: subtilisin family serine protease [Pseudoalteromonas tetraodonis]|jgi:subtilisin family serine protease
MGSVGNTTCEILTASGAGVRVGLIDTGVDSRHEDLAGKIAANYEAVMGFEENFVDEVEFGTDHNAHGTACAGILNRAAPEAVIHSVQVIGEHGQDNPEKLIAGLRFAVEQGWEVINISAGAGKPNDELHELVKRAHDSGTILIAAKDNRPEVIGYPAAYPEVICVDMEYLPDALGWRCFPGRAVEVEANGIYIEAPVAGGGRKSYTGTSFAAPTVSGIAARWKELTPGGGMVGFREFLKTDGLRR